MIPFHILGFGAGLLGIVALLASLSLSLVPSVRSSERGLGMIKRTKLIGFGLMAVCFIGLVMSMGSLPIATP